jgi:hypothetical protein
LVQIGGAAPVKVVYDGHWLRAELSSAECCPYHDTTALSNEAKSLDSEAGTL